MASGNGRGRNHRSWNQQFDSSLRRWSASRQTPKGLGSVFPLTDPLQRAIDDAVREMVNPDPKSLFYDNRETTAKIIGDSGQSESLAQAFRALLHFRARDILVFFQYAVSRCETAIEIPLLLALTIVGKAMVGRVTFGDLEDETGGRRTLNIMPQEDIGEYRVDFLLTLTYLVSDLSPRKKEYLDPKHKEKKMVVECDGHDFHDRSKEQARKDRSRDRALQSLGYRVFRYTGSEIWSDVFKCAREAVATLLEEANKDWETFRRSIDPPGMV